MCHDVIKVPNFFESIFVLKNRALFSIEKKKEFQFFVNQEKQNDRKNK